MSNVDTLLDFDSPPEKGPSQSQAGNGPALDPFDPFGPSPTLDSKAGNGLLLDFETNVQNGASTENGGDNVNLLYEFESGNRNDLYNLGEEDDSVRTEDLAALIKQQSDEDEQIVVTESVTRDEGGQTTVVTTRRSRSYDSDRELSPEVEHVVEESMTTSDDGMVVRKVIKTTTMQSEYLDESSDFSDQNRYEDQSLERESLEEQTYEEQPSLEEQTYEEQPSVEEQTYEEQPSVEEQTYEERPSVEEQLYEEREESSFDERLLNVENQSYEDNPSVDNQSYEDRSQEGSLVEVSYEERSYDDNPSFTEQHAEDIEAHKRRSMTPSPSSSDDEQQQTLEDPHKRRSMSPSPAEIRGQPETKNTSHQVRPAYEHLSLNRNTRSTPDSVPSHGRRISDENQYEVINFDPAPARDRQYSSLYETLSLNTEPNSNHRYRFGSSKEEEIIKNGATFYRTEDDKNISDEQEESQTMVKEELGPGQLKSPFFGDGPKPENGVHVDESDVERDPNIAREVRSRDQIKFAELSNFKNKFEAGVESKKSTTVSSAELDKVRQSSGAGSLKNKFENAGKDDNLNQERKAMREITPPQPDAKIVYEKEAVRDPNVIRSEDVIDEGVYMPKPGSSKEIRDKFKSGKIQESAPTQRSSVIDEIKEVEGGVYENEPQINPDVVRSGEGDQFADLPSTGSTRSVLSKFKQMESSTGYVPAPRGVREITPPSGGKVEYVSEPTAHVEKYEGKAESGVFESKPEYHPDVVRSGELPSEGTEQLPQQGFTKSAAALFRQKEAEAARVKTASTGGLRPLTPPRDQPVVYENEPQRLPDVVRSEDKKEVDLPQSGSAKNMLAKFRQWESTGGPPNQVQRQPKAFTPPREGEGGVYENTPEKFVPDYGNTSEGGVYENQPQHRDDVVRSDVRAGEELPGQGSAKNMVAKFRQLGDSTKSQSPISPRSPHDRSFKEFTPPREDPRSPGIQPADMPDQYQQASGGVSESKPQLRDDVVREADTDYEAGMPAPSTTKNLLARFKAIQQDVKTKEDPKPLRKESPQLYNRPSPSPNTPNSKEGGVPRFRAVQPEKCASCQKTVYAMEKMEFNKNVYHKTCFKCSHCKNRLTPATFSVNQGILYCLNHFKQMFKTKGNYDEGFGREQYKKKWKSEPNIAGLSDDEHAVSRS